ncbi:hypothetical protein QBC43DRAFT_104664 [Cladorrhinum sp. PSN259]|nr:hypothetical protein QBC43DRAFT_104664 [Cladorrhinum sp. PSN259]
MARPSHECRQRTLLSPGKGPLAPIARSAMFCFPTDLRPFSGVEGICGGKSADAGNSWGCAGYNVWRQVVRRHTAVEILSAVWPAMLARARHTGGPSMADAPLGRQVRCEWSNGNQPQRQREKLSRLLPWKGRMRCSAASRRQLFLAPTHGLLLYPVMCCRLQYVDGAIQRCVHPSCLDRRRTTHLGTAPVACFPALWLVVKQDGPCNCHKP